MISAVLFLLLVDITSVTTPSSSALLTSPVVTTGIMTTGGGGGGEVTDTVTMVAIPTYPTSRTELSQQHSRMIYYQFIHRIGWHKKF